MILVIKANRFRQFDKFFKPEGKLKGVAVWYVPISRKS